MEKQYQYDVAISFAEEDRNAALALSQSLAKYDLKAYYYPDSKEVALGHNLGEKLAEIYSQMARYAVVLFSKKYLNEDKVYVKIELEAIQNRMREEPGNVYMIPVRLESGLSLDEYPELAKITYLDWNHAPDIIAEFLKKLLGKPLVHENEAEKGNIVYSIGDGDGNFVIAGSKIENLNQNFIKTETTNVEGDLNIVYPQAKEKKVTCPYCQKEHEFTNYGQNTCARCKETFFIPAPITATEYKTLKEPKELKEYRKIIAHINNKMWDGEYEEAHKYCLKAEEIAPAEPTTWEYFAQIEFFTEIRKHRSVRKPTIDIIRSIKIHIDKCKAYGLSDEKCKQQLSGIANRLFELEGSRIKSYQPKYKDEAGNEKWTRHDLHQLVEMLKSLEMCYGLFNNVAFLEEYITELSKPYKWVIKSLTDKTIKNTITLDRFDAAEKLKLLENKIREHKPDYNRPEILEERLIIRRKDYLKILSVSKNLN